MKSWSLYAAIFMSIFIISCKENKETPEVKETEATKVIKTPKPVFSFSFVGCNRIDRHNQSSANPSTANTYALERIYADMDTLPHKPELFFFLGDLVLAETTTTNLDVQLNAWQALYDANPISKSGIELVAVPGNHEMLYSKEVYDTTQHHGPNHIPNKNDSIWKEFPLKGSTNTWLKYMKNYMPSGRETAPDTLGLDNRLTFSFTRHNVGFVVMNTDTYNPPKATNPYKEGLEGQLPVTWVNDKVKTFKKDSTIDHIFVLGHRPYYVGGSPDTGHGGLPQGGELWPTFQDNRVVAMLSAHQHDYERWQPINDSLKGGTYQIVAGHGGSVNNRHIPHSPPFFGYSLITVMSDGTIKLDTRGYCTGDTYLTPVPTNQMISRDTITMTWAQNPNTFPDPYLGCESK